MVLITFLLNAALVTLAAVLISPIYLVKFNNGIGIGLSAFTAAIVGGFNQARGAVAGGLLLGVVETFAATFGPDQYRDAVPMLLLILFDIVPPAGSARPARGASGVNSQTRVLAGALGLALAAGLLAFGLQPYGVYLLSLWAVYTISAIGLNLTLGYAGQVSLAQAVFVGIGAYTTALLMPHGAPFGVDAADRRRTLFWSSAWCWAIPALRVQGHYLAFVTLALHHARLPGVAQRGVADGRHLRHQPHPRPAPFTGAVGYLGSACLSLALVAFADVVAAALAVGPRLRRVAGEPGARRRAWGSTSGLHAAGIRHRRGAGRRIADRFYAPLVQFIEPTPFALAPVVQPAADGGGRRVGIVLRAVLGAVVAVLLPEWLRFLQDYYLMIYARAGDPAAGCFCPDGLVGLADRLSAGCAGAAPRRPRHDRWCSKRASLHKHFGGVQAVNGVSLPGRAKARSWASSAPTARASRRCSTACSASSAPTRRPVRLDGRGRHGHAPAAISTASASSRTFQLLQVFPQLSVRENLILAGQEHVGTPHLAAVRARPTPGLPPRRSG